jgi:VanZ family protein
MLIVALWCTETTPNSEAGSNNRLMTSDSKTRLIGLLGAAAFAALAMAALLPTKWVPRTGLGWQVEHFSIYFATTLVLCIAFRRPYVIAISVIVSSAILEALQGLTPDRVPDLTSALCGAAGAISAAILIEFFIRARGRRATPDTALQEPVSD